MIKKKINESILLKINTIFTIIVFIIVNSIYLKLFEYKIPFLFLFVSYIWFLFLIFFMPAKIIYIFFKEEIYIMDENTKNKIDINYIMAETIHNFLIIHFLIALFLVLVGIVFPIIGPIVMACIVQIKLILINILGG